MGQQPMGWNTLTSHAWLIRTLVGESWGGVVTQGNQDAHFSWKSGYWAGKKKTKNRCQHQEEIKGPDQDSWSWELSASVSRSFPHMEWSSVSMYSDISLHSSKTFSARLITVFPKEELLMEIPLSCNLVSPWQGLHRLSYRNTPECCQISQQH